MEPLLVILVLLFFIGLPLMMIIALVKLGFLREEIADLRRKLDLKQRLEETKVETRTMKREETTAAVKGATEVPAPP